MKEGLVSGPHTVEAAAHLCRCHPRDLCYVPLAAKREGPGKIRTVNDGTATGVNIHIKHHLPQQTTTPQIHDLLHGIATMIHEPVSYTHLTLPTNREV